MTQYANTAEGGTNGTTVTAANSGGASGDAFDTVTIGSGATLIFDNTHAAHGTLAYKVATGASSVTVIAEKVLPAATSTVAIRGYGYFTANPSTAPTIATVAVSGGTRARIRVNTAGKLQVLDSTGTLTSAALTTAIPLNAWFRFEAQFTLSGTVGQATITRFDTIDSGTATESVSSAANLNLGGTADRVRWGIPVGVASVVAFWLDDLAENDTGAAIGPALTLASGTASLSLSGSGATAAPVTSAGSLSLSASGTAAAGTNQATGTASLDLTAAGVTAAPVTSTAVLSLLATLTAAAQAQATATLTLLASGTAAGFTPTSTPPERVYLVPAENRVYRLPAEV